MIIPVMGVLTACYILPIMHYLFFFTQNSVYWEVLFGMLLSFATNAACNLPIYYSKGPYFKVGTKAALRAYKARLCSFGA